MAKYEPSFRNPINWHIDSKGKAHKLSEMPYSYLINLEEKLTERLDEPITTLEAELIKDKIATIRKLTEDN